MSRLDDWIAANLYPGGEVDFTALFQAFAADLNTYDRKQWTRGKVEQALAGRIEKRGRRDRPTKVVVGLSFEPLVTSEVLCSRIVEACHKLVLGRYDLTVYKPFDQSGTIKVTERPDYTEDGYSLTYSGIADKLSHEVMRCSEADVIAALAWKAKFVQQYIMPDTGWHPNEREAQFNRYVRCLTPSGVVGYRWRRPDDPSDTDGVLPAYCASYHGPLRPLAGQKTLTTTVEAGVYLH